ncbi:MAG TPA: hypothetical protein DCQ64_12950 [Candidatus Rokubacteria bacterium]|nr:hypothetical protein [Candidatus Rokubacteria bacterium]
MMYVYDRGGHMIQLGDRVRDNITGFEGVATGRTEYLYGCVRICIEPSALQEGKPIEAIWFDEQRLDKASAAKTGGPALAPSHRDPPAR